MVVWEFTKYCIRGILGIMALPFVLFLAVVIGGNAIVNNIKNIFSRELWAKNDE